MGWSTVLCSPPASDYPSKQNRLYFQYESSHLILMGGGGGSDKFGGLDFWWPSSRLNLISDPEGGVEVLVHTLLANMFNKCHKKLLLWYTKLIWVYQIWAWVGEWIVLCSREVIYFAHAKGDLNYFWLPIFQTLPPPILNGHSLIV